MAEGGSPPEEIILLNHIDRFGVEAVMGCRTLGAGIIRRMNAADNIVRAYRSRASSENWAEWAEKNQQLSHLLNDAMIIAEDENA